MPSLLELIRQQRASMLARETTRKVTSTGLNIGQKAVNDPLKKVFDKAPKPSDFLLIDRFRQEKAFKDIGVSPQTRASSKTIVKANSPITNFEIFIRQNPAVNNFFLNIQGEKGSGTLGKKLK